VGGESEITFEMRALFLVQLCGGLLYSHVTEACHDYEEDGEQEDGNEKSSEQEDSCEEESGKESFLEEELGEEDRFDTKVQPFGRQEC
jgi:hypothetical protein